MASERLEPEVRDGAGAGPRPEGRRVAAFTLRSLEEAVAVLLLRCHPDPCRPPTDLEMVLLIKLVFWLLAGIFIAPRRRGSTLRGFCISTGMRSLA